MHFLNIRKVSLLLLLFASSIFSKPNKYIIDFLYVNANTGESSGGHSALKIGELVYHFQYHTDKVFHIEREYWNNFYYLYGIQGNRTTFVHRIRVSKDTWMKVREFFNFAYLVQIKHLEVLKSLKYTREIFETFLSNDKKVELSGLGYYSNYKKNSELDFFIRQVKQKYGSNYLESQITKLKKKISTINFLQSSLDITKVSRTHFQNQNVLLSDKYYNTLYKLEALKVLKLQKALKPKTYFSVYNILKDNDYYLSEFEKQKLIYFKQDLQNNLLHLLSSERKDWGYPMLIGLARLLVIEKSLQENKLFFLDCFGNIHYLIKKKVITNLKHKKKLKQDSYRLFLDAKSLFFSNKKSYENDYRQMEDIANRYQELRIGIDNSLPVRSSISKLLPQKKGYTRILHKLPSEKEIKTNLRIAKQNEYHYHEKLREIYDYHLIYENCTTAIFDYLNNAFEFNPTLVKRNLGGNISENDLFVFVPFFAYYKVGKEFNVISSKEILSVRRKLLNQFSQNKNNFWINLRESNTISSKIYRFNSDDSFFIFFTDDVFFLRPFMGFFNLLAGIGESSYGVLKLPLDKGDRLLKGIRGVFFSLPELVFFNIRKGTFTVLDKDDLKWLQEEAEKEFK